MQLFTLTENEQARRQFTELLRFVVVGLVASAMHLGTLFALTEYTPLWYLPSTIIGFGLGFLISFTLQKYWTFKDRTTTRMYGQITKFFLLQAGALFVNAGGLYILVEFFGLWYLLAQAILLGLVAISTYLLSKFVIFTPKEDAYTMASHT